MGLRLCGAFPGRTGLFHHHSAGAGDRFQLQRIEDHARRLCPDERRSGELQLYLFCQHGVSHKPAVIHRQHGDQRPDLHAVCFLYGEPFERKVSRAHTCPHDSLSAGDHLVGHHQSAVGRLHPANSAKCNDGVGGIRYDRRHRVPAQSDVAESVACQFHFLDRGAHLGHRRDLCRADRGVFGGLAVHFPVDL